MKAGTFYQPYRNKKGLKGNNTVNNCMPTN